MHCVPLDPVGRCVCRARESTNKRLFERVKLERETSSGMAKLRLGRRRHPVGRQVGLLRALLFCRDQRFLARCSFNLAGLSPSARPTVATSHGRRPPERKRPTREAAIRPWAGPSRATALTATQWDPQGPLRLLGRECWPDGSLSLGRRAKLPVATGNSLPTRPDRPGKISTPTSDFAPLLAATYRGHHLACSRRPAGCPIRPPGLRAPRRVGGWGKRDIEVVVE